MRTCLWVIRHNLSRRFLACDGWNSSISNLFKWFIPQIRIIHPFRHRFRFGSVGGCIKRCICIEDTSFLFCFIFTDKKFTLHRNELKKKLSTQINGCDWVREKQSKLCNVIMVAVDDDDGGGVIARFGCYILRTLNVQMAFNENEKSLCFCIVLHTYKYIGYCSFTARAFQLFHKCSFFILYNMHIALSHST